MELVIVAGEREVRVEVRHTPEGYEVRLGDQTWQVDRVYTRGALTSLLVNDRQFEVSVHAETDDRYRVVTAHGRHEIQVSDPLTWLARQSHATVAGAGRQEIAAYMPGRVVEVLVAEGDTVEPGQGLIVLEAMKMENEIQAELAGTVAEVKVAQGDAVEGGQALITISSE